MENREICSCENEYVFEDCDLCESCLKSLNKFKEFLHDCISDDSPNFYLFVSNEESKESYFMQFPDILSNEEAKKFVVSEEFETTLSVRYGVLQDYKKENGFEFQLIKAEIIYSAVGIW